MGEFDVLTNWAPGGIFKGTTSEVLKDPKEANKNGQDPKVCMYTYTYTHTHIYAHIHIYIYRCITMRAQN